MDRAELVTFATALFTILNPIGNVAIFASMVGDRTAAERRATAIKCGLAVAVILVATVWAGEYVLHLFGVQIPSLQVAGGLMIAAIALSMLHSRQSAIHDTKKDDEEPAAEQQPPSGQEAAAPDIAVVPLAMPIIAGPGAMVTVIVNTHQHRGIWPNVELSLVCGALAAVVCAGFLAAGPITRLLGNKGMDIVTKLMGMVLLAIAASMLAEGAKGLLPGLAG